jgi:pimeloyl-ACP methyl ester carboxylesterase
MRGADADEGDLASHLGHAAASRGLPLLIIHGIHDKLVPVANSERLARLLGGSGADVELLLLERCGHMPHEEHPSLFAELVADWAARRLRG